LDRKYFNFLEIFKNSVFDFKTWLFLWLEVLKEHKIDDVRSGKVTVMGVLESRALEFDAVIVIDFNQNYVPAVSNKDRFLNSAVRKSANLPTIKDRQDLQKHYYFNLFNRAKNVFITYTQSEDLIASNFLFELNLDNKIKNYQAPLELLFPKESFYISNSHEIDTEISFNPKDFIWSSSSLKSYLRCKREFFYRYILKIKEPISLEIKDGLILHNIFSKILNKNSSYKDANELKKAFLKEVALLQDSKELKFKTLLWSQMLEDFFNKQIIHLKSGWKIWQSEYSVSGTIEGLKFSGRVDRIDKKDDFSLIIDYKSSSSKDANVNIEKLIDFQMVIYSKLLDIGKNRDFAFIEVLKSGDFVYLKDYEEKERKFIEILQELSQKNKFVASRCEDFSVCRNCAYRLLCHRGEYL